MISPTILPSPVEVLKSFKELWFDRALVRNLGVSFGRVVEGFALAVAVVFPLGVFMGGFTKIKAMFSPLLGVRRLHPDSHPGTADIKPFWRR